MLEAWYPSSADKENLYVYLNTLQTDNPGLYSAAQALVKANNSQEFENEARIETALEFLNLAADNELQKELHFLSSKFDSSVLSEIMDGNTINYPKMIAKINEANKTLDKYQTELQQEKARFERVQASKKQEDKKNVYHIGKGKFSYSQGLGGYIQSALRQLTGLSQEQESKISQICRSILIKKINETNAFNGLDISQVAAVIGLAQVEIMPFLEKELNAGNLFRSGGKLSISKIEEVINKNESFLKLYSSSLENLQSISNRLINAYGRIENKKGNENKLKLANKNFNEALKNLTQIKNSSSRTNRDRAIRKILNNNGSILTEDSIGLNINFSGKNTGLALEYKIANEISNSVVVGGSGGKIDVSSFLLGEFDINIDFKTKPIQNILNSINQNTQADFGAAGDNFLKAYRELNEYIEEQRRSGQDIKDSFILHTSAKDYYSTATDEFKGFKGGTYQGLQIFDSLEALAGAGFGEADIQWLKACAVNTSKSAVGASIKSSLEEYISIFATMLLFDDGVTIAKETVAKAQSSFQPVSVLHLFNLNGFYVPSSYLLRELYTRLTNAVNNLPANKIVKAKIEPGAINFQDELDYLSINYVFQAERWRAIRNIQINAMSVKIYFLRNFMDILNELTGV